MFARRIPSSLLLLLAFAVPAAADDDERRSITVLGTAEVAAAPDMAVVQAGVVGQAATAAAAVADSNAAMGEVLAALEDLGVAEKDVQTSRFGVSPVYSDRSERRDRPEIVGYRVENRVRVRVRDLDRLGRVLDQLVTAGANTMGGIQFELADPAPVLDQARQGAVADARRKAELLAGAAEARLGRVLRIEEAVAAPPVPMGRRVAMAEAAAVPVARGELELTASVRVTWALE